jgi:hypothetical protein
MSTDASEIEEEAYSTVSFTVYVSPAVSAYARSLYLFASMEYDEIVVLSTPSTDIAHEYVRSLLEVPLLEQLCT